MKIDGLPIDVQVAAAVGAKVNQVAAQQGQASVELIRAAADAPPPPPAPGVATEDGRGLLVSTTA